MSSSQERIVGNSGGEDVGAKCIIGKMDHDMELGDDRNIDANIHKTVEFGFYNSPT